MTITIPQNHRAMIFEEWAGPLKIKTFPVPEPAEDELLVKIQFSGICHSDLHAWLGDLKEINICPLIGGHEGAGTVVKVGKKVTGWKVGDHAGVKIGNYTCLNCEYCKSGNEQLCPLQKNYGFTHHGTFQEYVTIRGVDTIKIPDGLSLSAAAPILCGGVTSYKALKETGAKPGEIVVVTGAGGGLGSFAIQYGKAMGLRMVAIDHVSKKEHCLKLGAEWFVDAFNTPNMIEHIKSITEGGPHGVVNFAVAKEPMEQALEYVRKMGTVVFVGLPKDGKILVNTFPLIFNAINVKGSYVGSRLDVDEAMNFAARGTVNVPLELVRLEDIPTIYQKMKDGTQSSRAVIDFSL